MTRILFLGDLAATGFGTVTMDLGRELLELGDDVRFVSLNEVGNLPEPFASRTLSLGTGWLTMPTNEEEAAAYLERERRLFTDGAWDDGWAPEAAILLGDAASVKFSPILPLIPDGFPIYHYVPVEGVGLPPRWAEMWRKVRPVAMSEFGADQIAPVIGTRPPVVYHGVDTAAFYPVSSARPIVIRGEKELHVMRSKADCKRFFGVDPSRIWLFRADRHMPRKLYGSLFRALAPVLAKHPNVDLVYHCRTVDQGGDLDDERSKFGRLAARMISTGFHDQYGGVDRKVLAALYNAADIYVSNSAEGFGLTIAEAIACGVPAVGMAYSSVPEVIGHAGLLVPPISLIDNIYSHFWATVDERKFAEAVESLVLDVARRQYIGALGPAHVRHTFSWATAARLFSDLIAGAVRQEVAA